MAIQVFTPEGVVEFEPAAELKSSDRVETRGNAKDCIDVDDPETTSDGHIEVEVFNDCDERVKVKVMWGGVLGCGPATVRTIRAGQSKVIRTQRQGPIGVCWVEANLSG